MTNDPSTNHHPVGTANAIGWRVGSFGEAAEIACHMVYLAAYDNTASNRVAKIVS
jgi:hypothetical protein